MGIVKRVLLTGSGGFVGSHVLRHILCNTDWEVVCPVTFRHRGHSGRVLEAVKGIPNWRSRINVVVWDLATPFTKTLISDIGRIDYILNVASQSHVDRSIIDPVGFIKNNVDLALNLLEYAREVKPTLFLQMSTDEVFGPADDSYAHHEWDSIAPSNPYSSSKAAQEAIAIAYWRTFGVPVIITNTMNIIGEMQDREKFIVKTIKNVLTGRPIIVHSSKEGKPGSRFYIHARNFADAWLYIIKNAPVYSYHEGHTKPNRYNIVGEKEIDNKTMVEMIAGYVREICERDGEIIAEPDIQLVDFHSSRPGHDLRYALDGTKLAGLGWKPPSTIEESLRKTVEWTLDQPDWMI